MRGSLNIKGAALVAVGKVQPHVTIDGTGARLDGRRGKNSIVPRFPMIVLKFERVCGSGHCGRDQR